MNRVRVIPILLLDDAGLYKTRSFKNPIYIGDPINAVKIFNEKEVDELIIIDYTARMTNRAINYQFIEDIVSEAFMPICYGGYINDISQCEKLFRLGVEKISLNYSAVNNPNLLSKISNRYGSQSVVVSIDVKKNIFGTFQVYTSRGTEKVKTDIIDFARKMEDYGAGELLVTSIDREGTSKGYDIDLIRKISESVNIPVVANGGANSLKDMLLAVKEGKASAVAAGSMFVFWGELKGILVNYPTQKDLHDQVYSKL